MTGECAGTEQVSRLSFESAHLYKLGYYAHYLMSWGVICPQVSDL